MKRLMCLIGLLAVLAGAAPANGENAEALPWLALEAPAAVWTAGGETVLRPEEPFSLSLEVQEAGEYYITLAYRPVEEGNYDNVVLVETASGAMRSALPFLWEDVPGDMRYDKYGNEIPKDQQLAAQDSRSYLEEYTLYSRRPHAFFFAQGVQTITFTAENMPFLLKEVAFIPKSQEKDYGAYAREVSAHPLGTDFITIQAEDYALKNDSFLRGTNIKNTAVLPSDPYVKRINALADKSFKNPGQKVLYTFEITTPGRYALAFKYAQPLKAGMPVFRTLEIDGQVLFSQMRDVPFAHTGLNVYGNLTFSQAGDPYYIYLDKGVHTIAFKVTAGDIDPIYQSLTRMIGEMNDMTLKIKKLTGQSSDDAANIDVHRTWNVLDYLPTILEDIAAWQAELADMRERLRAISGQEPAFASDLNLVYQNLEKLAEDPRTLPNKVNLLGDDQSSAAQLLGTMLPKLTEQNLSLDCLYIYDGVSKLPDPKESFWQSLKTGVQQFFYSFSPVMNESASRNDSGKLTVWVNKSSQYVEVLQDLCAKTFTQETGIDVTFSIMPKEDKLILANASGMNPDVVVGTSIQYPFDLGVRGIAKNLLEYEGFAAWYAREYNLESLVPFSYNGGVYAACDTQEFRVLFYRKDILDMLNLAVPETMDDVRAMLPVLHRNAMNFSLPLSTNKEGYKGFSQTMPFVYQNGGDVYAADGLSATLTSPAAAKGLREMCDLYQVYGCLTNVKSFFNSFRSGAIPLGISEYGTYLQLMTAAPELAGLWDIALAPGTRDENGNILRYQAAVDTGTMILANTQMPQEAYAFLTWWLSSQTQLQYATELQRKYGPDYKWNTANLTAFSQMGFPQKHKQVILSMWREWQKETPRHLASYMLEREISNLWGYAVKEGKPFMPALDAAEKAINREMLRKLNEFGFVDGAGNVLTPYNNHTVSGLADKKEGRE